MVVPDRSAFVEMFGSAPVPRILKKTRVQLTHTEKKRNCEVQIDNPQWTQEKISQFISKEFDKAIGRALISKILKEGEKWTSVTAQRVNCDIALEEQILNTSARGECGEKHYM